MSVPSAKATPTNAEAIHVDDWRSFPPVLVSSIWDEDVVYEAVEERLATEEAAAPSGDRKRSGKDLDAVRKARVDAKRRTAYEKSHFALIGRPAPTVIPFRRGSSSSFHKSAAPPAPATRVLRNLYISQVGRFQYRLIHRLEGRWNGEATVIAPGHLPEVRVVSTELTYDSKAGRWHERQSLTDGVGLTSTQIFHYLPAADGVLTVTSDDPYLSESVDMRMVEHSENVLILTAISHETAKPLIVETVTVVDNLRRLRTVQRFDESGQFKCLYLVKENRVIDAVSGAMEEFHGDAAMSDDK